MASKVSGFDALRLLLWKHIKDVVFRQRPETISELKAKIRNAMQSIDGYILRKAYKNMETRLSFAVRQQGGDFEHSIN